MNNSAYAWACMKLREAVDQKMHGNVIFNIKNGDIKGLEIQKHERFDETNLDGKR